MVLDQNDKIQNFTSIIFLQRASFFLTKIRNPFSQKGSVSKSSVEKMSSPPTSNDLFENIPYEDMSGIAGSVTNNGLPKR